MAIKCPQCQSNNPTDTNFCGNCGTRLLPSEPLQGLPTETKKIPAGRFSKGTVIGGRYEILDKLGEGGMGIVYKAEDKKLNRTVALKFISARSLTGGDEESRFFREAQAIASFDHPNICTIFEIDEFEGQAFIAMAYVKGHSLQAKIQLAPLKLEEALDIVFQIAEGLEEAHDKGVVHRDIKSSNIMITDKGQVKIMDFGLAKLAQRSQLTKTAGVMGTVAYMSPEQASGKPVDRRTDLWSLGVIFFEMLTGQFPFKGESPQAVLHAVLNNPQEALTSLRSGIPLSLESIVNKCLEKDPEERYQTAADLKADLRRLRRELFSGSVTATLPGLMAAKPSARRRVKWISIPAGLLFLIIMVLLIPSLREKAKGWLGVSSFPEEKHLAVLPFTLIGGSDADRAFCVGLTELLVRKIERLATLQNAFWVVPTSQIQRYEVKDATEARQILGVNLVISGSMKRLGEMLTLTLDVIDPHDLHRLGTLSKTDHIANLFTWQEEIVQQTAASLRIPISPPGKRPLAADSTTVPEAFESYLKGLGFLKRSEKGEDLDSAIRELEEAIEQDPSLAAAYGDLAEGLWKKYLAAKEPSLAQSAESRCRQAIQINGELSSYYVTLAKIHRGLGRNDEAIQDCKKALEINPFQYEAKIQLADIYDQTRQPEMAEAAYKESLQIRPGYWAAYGSLGFFYFFQGSFEKARDAFLQLTKISPGNILGLNNLGAAYYKLGDNALAAETFEKSRATKRNAVACSNLGVIYYFQGRFADSTNMNEEAIELGQNNYYIWGNLADAYHFTQEYAVKAADAYRKAIELAEKDLAAEPDNPQIRSSLAVYLAKSGLRDRAKNEIDKVLRTRPNDSTVVLKSVLIFELMNDRRLALEALEKYLRLKGPIDEILRDPFMAKFRTDPRYLELVKQAMTGAPK